ncbi:MAG TPA: PhnD/SsuA/transferrin family substrate-binding protein [Candidatus Methylomirabilis sp.]|nr:PhnD/SsuA/transferrin family substrate-binding protein [Candidatus Methylomirabilis sp.]
MRTRTMTHASVGMMSLGALALTVVTVATAAVPNTPVKVSAVHKTAFTPPDASGNKPPLEGVDHGIRAGTADVLVFGAPPRETEAEGIRTYQPVAEYLSRIIGKKIVYKHPNDWLTYQTAMQRGSYDLVFDGPHFNSWRLSNLQHHMLVKVVGENSFAVVVRKDDSRFTDVKQLVGQKVCGMDPPNLGTLAVLGQFNNPLRQPFIVNNLGWTRVYEGLAFEKKCAAAILPMANLEKFANSESLVRILFKTKALPNQAFSAGPRISPEDRAAIAAALISQEGADVTARMRAAYGGEKGLAYATKTEYTGLDVYLKNTWGYSR